MTSLEKLHSLRKFHMNSTAKGTFEVKLLPLTFENQTADSKLGRMSIDKKISGDLEAITSGQMLSAMTEIKGSAGYVAIEKVTGTLHGKQGSFVLQHSGTMNRGTDSVLLVSVVPDSGTGELVGLQGTFNIIIADGQHNYEFVYSLPSHECMA
jgi:imidazole glycerol phosphate synthase subunit HisF